MGRAPRHLYQGGKYAALRQNGKSGWERLPPWEK